MRGEVKGISGRRSSLSKGPRYEMLWFGGVARISYGSSLELREETKWKVRGKEVAGQI